jgi:AcrR family transcriptional regulator
VHVPRGRHRDSSRDPEIQRATVELLAEHGYDRLTIDAVAARAHAGKATIYRRWPGKADLVLDALSTIESPPPEAADTGSLRGDLLALLCDVHEIADESRVQLMAGLVPALRRDAELARAFDDRFVEPRRQAVNAAFDRARARGEIGDEADVELLGAVLPALVIFRVLMMREQVDADFAARVVDNVITPATVRRPEPTATKRRPLRPRPGRSTEGDR